MITYDAVQTAISRLWIAISARGLCRIEFDGPEEKFLAGLRRKYGVEPAREGAAIEPARSQVLEYLAGDRVSFDLALDLEGMSPFHREALAVCASIPYGQTRTYAELARELGKPGGARAVGNAMARNPIPLVIPCHRVLRSDGSLGGFGGGLSVKRRLLEMEGGRLPE